MKIIDIDQLTLLLNKSPIFSQLSKEHVLHLSPYLEIITLKAGDILFNQGDEPQDVYVLIQGEFESFLKIEKYAPRKIGVILPFEVIGELGVIANEPRSLTIKATADSELLKIAGSAFIQLCQESSVVALEMMRLISQRSIKTIRFFSKEKFYKFIAIFTADKNVMIDDFKNQLQKNLDNYPVKLLNEEINNEESLLKIITQKEYKNNYIIIFLKPNFLNYYKLLQDNLTQFYLLANSSENPHLSEDAKKILEYINPEDKFNLKLIILQKNDSHPVDTRKWLSKANFHLHHHVRKNNAEDYQRLIRYMIGKATGLVLSGGGARGLVHLGIIKALTDCNIPIDAIGGTSNGSITAGFYALSQDYEVCVTLYERIKRPILKSIAIANLTWPIISLWSSLPFSKMLQEIYGDVYIEDLFIPFFSVSCNITTQKEVAHRTGLLSEAVYSSCAPPAVFPPMVIDGQLHYDGGLLNNLPVDVMRHLIGEENIIIASDVSHRWKKEVRYHFPHILNLKEALIYKLGIKHKDFKFPTFFELFYNALSVGSTAKNYQNTFLANVLIKPDLSKYSLLNFDPKLIEIGYQEGLKAIKEHFKK